MSANKSQQSLLPTAIVLLSGGLDSTTVLAIAQERGFNVVALSFQYGQNHSREIEQAVEIAKHGNVVEHCLVNIYDNSS